MAPTPAQIDRLRRELEFLTAHPERHDQGTWYRLPRPEAVDAEPGTDWTCGTSGCLAGWTALHADYQPWVDKRGYVADDARVVRPGPGPAYERLVDVHDLARDLLGLTDRQANLLFGGDNALRDLWEYARVFTNGAIVVPADVAAEPTYAFDPEDAEDAELAGDA